jgi:hypothetical protein
VVERNKHSNVTVALLDSGFPQTLDSVPHAVTVGDEQPGILLEFYLWPC